MTEFTLRSSHGKIVANAKSGAVLDTDLSDEWPTGMPLQVNVAEWRSHYPGEELKGEHDVLDFGYWYVDKEDDEVYYNGPCEDWRTDREARIKEERDANVKTD